MLDQAGVEADYSHLGSGHNLQADTSRTHAGISPRYRRVVLLVRDPRDTVVSGYHQASKRRGVFEGSIAEFLRDPRHGIEKVVRYNLELAELARNRPGAMIVSYEMLKRDPQAVLVAVAAHFGKDLARDDAERIVAESTFEKMQAQERSGELAARYGRTLTARDTADPESFKVRKGKVGSYREELSPGDIAYADALLAREDYFGRMDAALARHVPR
jgi:hypothetical protein